MSTSHRMTPLELRASLSLAGVFGLRLLGMFIILPVFALYAEQLRGGDDHTLIGLALGAYGLTQAVLQIPFGSLSDRWGRKKTIYLGLLIFAAGSFIAAVAQDIHVVILGRVIQGAGAISAAVMALAADLTRDEQRTKAMAIIGVTIGAAFALSMVGGPVLNRWIGVPGIFALTGLLALFAIALVRFVVPAPAMAVPVSGIASRVRFVDILRHPQLLRLNYGIFILSAVLMALWVVVPFELRAAGLAGRQPLANLPAGHGDERCADGAAHVDLGALGTAENCLSGGDRHTVRRATAARGSMVFIVGFGLGAAGFFHRLQLPRGEPAVDDLSDCSTRGERCGGRGLQQRAIPWQLCRRMGWWRDLPALGLLVRLRLLRGADAVMADRGSGNASVCRVFARARILSLKWIQQAPRDYRGGWPAWQACARHWFLRARA